MKSFSPELTSVKSSIIFEVLILNQPCKKTKVRNQQEEEEDDIYSLFSTFKESKYLDI